MHTISKSIASEIRTAMTAQRATVADVAAVAGVPQMAVLALLAGHRGADLDHLIGVCWALGIDVAALVGRAAAEHGSLLAAT